jgi:cardiolipin synthase
MTTANKITIVRILLVPFFIVQLLYYVRSGNELHWLLAVVSFAVAAVCDGVDGYIARRYNQRSELGAVLDPLADKLLLVSGILVLSLDHGPYFVRIPLWLTGTIVGRDVMLSIGVAVIHYTVGKVTVRPRITGKAATFFQMVLISWILLQWPEFWVLYLALAAAVFTGVSGSLYVWDGVRQLSASPASGATGGC